VLAVAFLPRRHAESRDERRVFRLL
jgi:hypothetical protein